MLSILGTSKKKRKKKKKKVLSKKKVELMHKQGEAFIDKDSFPLQEAL